MRIGRSSGAAGSCERSCNDKCHRLTLLLIFPRRSSLAAFFRWRLTPASSRRAGVLLPLFRAAPSRALLRRTLSSLRRHRRPPRRSPHGSGMLVRVVREPLGAIRRGGTRSRHRPVSHFRRGGLASRTAPRPPFRRRRLAGPCLRSRDGCCG